MVVVVADSSQVCVQVLPAAAAWTACFKRPIASGDAVLWRRRYCTVEHGVCGQRHSASITPKSPAGRANR
jgi:hypothetical protein